MEIFKKLLFFVISSKLRNNYGKTVFAEGKSIVTNKIMHLSLVESRGFQSPRVLGLTLLGLDIGLHHSLGIMQFLC